MFDFFYPLFVFSRKLKLIDLSSNEITDRGLSEISRFMENSKKIKVKTIRFACNNISNRGTNLLLDAIAKNKSQISELSFADNGLNEDFAK